MFSHLVFVWRLFPDTWGHACTPQPIFISCIPIQTIPQVSTPTNCSNIQGTRCRSAETNRRPTEEWQWRFLWGSRRPSKYLIGSNLIEIPGPAGWHELKSMDAGVESSHLQNWRWRTSAMSSSGLAASPHKRRRYQGQPPAKSPQL